MPAKRTNQETIQLSTIKGNPRNPRKISGEQLDKLCESIKRDPQFMKLRPIVVDGEGMILGGNQRYTACKKLGMREVPKEWIVKAGDLSEEQRKRFILVDNAPEGMTGDWDFEMLEADFGREFLESMAMDIVWEAGNPHVGGSGEATTQEPDAYVKTVTAPVYEITGEKPNTTDLCKTDRRDKLVSQIETTRGLPEDIKGFLLRAAERHTVFDFRNIAEFYAHSDKKVQRLFEASGLVIIDFDKAIEHGYVLLTKNMEGLYDKDWEGEEDSEDDDDLS